MCLFRHLVRKQLGHALLILAGVLVAAPLSAGAGPVRGERAPRAERSVRTRMREARRGRVRRGVSRRRIAARRGTLEKVQEQRLGRRPVETEETRRMRRTLRRPDHEGGIRQITGKDLKVGQSEFKPRLPADPFVDVLPDGRVHVYGTFESYLEFKSLDDMLRGGRYEVKPIESREPLANESSWDHMVQRWKGGPEVMYGGVMTAPSGEEKARWPQDNWTRRIYPFTRDAKGEWVRRSTPLFGAVKEGQQPTMVGHAYGHEFKTVKREVNGRPVEETWLFHEEIVSEHPMRTEIFARKMLDPFTASEEKVKILGVDVGGKPTLGRRQNSEEYLVEGPRPFDVKIDGETYHFVSFSSGDFNSDRYDLNFAWRKGDPIGEYTPYMDGRSKTPKLRGFAAALKKRYQLSWVGRAQVIRDQRGDYWAVFHAVDKRIRPEVDYRAQAGDLGRFQRNIYAVPLKFTKAPDGSPRIHLVDRPQHR